MRGFFLNSSTIWLFVYHEVFDYHFIVFIDRKL
jgi:hypothetical protein